MRIRRPYLKVVLVVSVPAKNKSARVTEIFSIVYTGGFPLRFSFKVGEDRDLVRGCLWVAGKGVPAAIHKGGSRVYIRDSATRTQASLPHTWENRLPRNRLRANRDLYSGHQTLSLPTVPE